MSETQEAAATKVVYEASAQSDAKSPFGVQSGSPPACKAQESDDYTQGRASENMASGQGCNAGGESACGLEVRESIQESRSRLSRQLGETSIIRHRQMERYYASTGKLLDSLGAAMRCTREAIEAALPDDPARAGLLNKLGVMLRDRYNITQTMEDLQEATQYFQGAVEATPPNHPDRPRRLRDLGMQRLEIFIKTMAPKTLEEAICTVQKAVEETPPRDSDRAPILNNLGLLLCYRGRATQAPLDLEKAIRNFKEAVEITPPGHDDLPGRLSNLANALRSLYHLTGELRHLEEAVRSSQEAIDRSSNYPDPAQLYKQLGDMLDQKYMKTQALEDLEGTIQNFQNAVNTTPLSHSHLPTRLSYLGDRLGERYRRTREVEDLEEAIRTCQEAVDRSSNHPDRAGILGNLANRLGERYYRTGQLKDLTEAIRFLQEAIKVTPLRDPIRPGHHTNLGILLRFRYNMTQALEDLDEAISNCQTAAEATLAGDTDRPKMLTHLGVMLGDRYNRTESPRDLEEAIRYSREAVQEAVQEKPQHHPDLNICLNNLGIRLGEKYDRTRQLQDLKEAISNFRDAIKATPSNHLNYSRWLNNLGMRLGDRYSRTRLPSDLDECIFNIQAAVNAAPPDNPDRAGLLKNLGNKLLDRYERTGLPEDLDNATAHFKEAAGLKNGLPMERIKAARSLGSIFIDNSRWLEASEALESAFEVLQMLNLRSLPRTDQQWVLSELSGISSDAASCALHANRPASDALKLLEAGRCIIAGFAINSRSDITDLRDKDPGLFEEYEKCREEISRYGTSPEVNAGNEYGARTVFLEKLLEDLAKIKAEVRRKKIPGLESFQFPLSSRDIMKLAEFGPIVTFNVSKIRSDAILVTSTRIWAINLPNFAHDELDEKVEFFSAAGTRSRRNARVRVIDDNEASQKEELQENLLWLWKVAVCPVFKELVKQQFQRIWWVAGGAIGRVPFHAAGDHTEGSLENTISRAVSSYTSTFKALRYAREKPKNKEPQGRMLLVNMPETPGHDKLDTQHEVAVIQDEFGDLVSLLTHPGKRVVLEELGRCSFAHFACHGMSYLQDPSEGGLVLVEKGEPTMLTIRELDGVNLGSAEVAYLSACSTAELPGGKLMDEAIHLSNSFQMIGFRHVIGTMWGADDYAAGEIARTFYRTMLFKSQGESRGEFQVAQALHDALVEFRGRPDMKEDVVKWGPFIHVGV